MDTRFPLSWIAPCSGALLGFLLGAMMALGQEPIHANRPTVRTGGFEELLQVDPRGGTVRTFPDFDLTKPGAQWQVNGLEMVYESVPGTAHGCYRMVLQDPEAYLVGMSQSSLTPQPNRRYVVSALICCDFSREAALGRGHTEINLGTFTYGPLSSQPEASPDRASMGHWNGLPDQTHGWVRWEWEYPSYVLGETTFFWFRPFAPGPADFRIADVKLVELPPSPLVPFGKGEGVTFRGGPGKLPMGIRRVASAGDRLTITTTGARYTFDGTFSTLQAEQLLEKQRRVAQWEFSAGLEDLEVLHRSDTECVLANDRITFGVQCDGMVMVAPQEETTLTLTSDLGGRWNRLIAGHLLVVDDWGGFTVNPALPWGSGWRARIEVGTPGLVGHHPDFD